MKLVLMKDNGVGMLSTEIDNLEYFNYNIDNMKEWYKKEYPNNNYFIIDYDNLKEEDKKDYYFMGEE